jgi:hypothetical protein
MTKYFCIGLHKTGTCSLHYFAINSGLKSTHSCGWDTNPKTLHNFDFFCDGGSHYNNQNEFKYQQLAQTYPTAKFIINIRNPTKWIVSKLKHGGWRNRTSIQPNLPRYSHKQWRHKSLANIEQFITHYYDYYIKILTFFLDQKDRVLVINISQGVGIDKLKELLKNDAELPHVCKAKTVEPLSNRVLKFIDDVIAKNKHKQQQLDELVLQYTV